MLTASAKYKIQSAFIDTFICGDLSVPPAAYPFLSRSISLSLSLFLLDPIGRNVFVGLIYLCRNICMYMKPTLYPLLPRGLFTKRVCTGIHAYEIMYVVVRLYMCLTSGIDTNVGVWSGQPNFPSTHPRDRWLFTQLYWLYWYWCQYKTDISDIIKCTKKKKKSNILRIHFLMQTHCFKIIVVSVY